MGPVGVPPYLYLVACPHDGVAATQRSGDTDESEARALVQQVEERDYNPPERERILEWQSQQDFPIYPDPDDPDACNVYRELDLPDEIFEKFRIIAKTRPPKRR